MTEGRGPPRRSGGKLRRTNGAGDDWHAIKEVAGGSWAVGGSGLNYGVSFDGAPVA